MSFLKKDPIRVALYFILALGAALRFYNYFGWSLSNDELSAITMLRFNTPRGWIGQGETLDGHPVGVQVFLYFWTKLFGNSAAAVRFPFIIMGILSIYVLYLIASKWFNKICGLFAALTLSVSSFAILYSQLARPYSPGLLFSLLTVWFWTCIIFPGKDKPNQLYPAENNKDSLSRKEFMNYLWFTLCVSVCMYTHYFSFLFVIIVGISGLFFIPGKKLKYYLLSGSVSCLLFLPHLEFTFEQLDMGGVSWLSLPNRDTFLAYIIYCLNDSDYFLFPVLGISLGALIFNFKNVRWSRFHRLSLIWFLLPFAIAYFYSIYKAPLLQFSILLFSFPFLIIFLFSFMPSPEIITGSLKKMRAVFVVLLFVSFAGLFSLIADTRFYSTQHFGVFRELAQTTINWTDKYGEKNITRTIDLNSPLYIDYYLEKMGRKITFAQYVCHSGDEVGNLKAIVDSVATPYFLYAWSTMYSPPEVTEVIRSKYPFLIERHAYFNSEIMLFGRKPEKNEEARKPFYYAVNDFENPGKWENDSIKLTSEISKSQNHSSLLDSTREFGPTFKEKIVNMLPPGDSAYMSVTVWGYAPEENANAELVVSFESLKGSYDWHSGKFKDYIHHTGRWGQVFTTCRIPKPISSDDLVKAYVWNPEKKKVYIDDMEIKVYEKLP